MPTQQAPPAVKTPAIATGKTCLWRPCPGAEPCAAIVTKGGTVVSLMVFPPEFDLPVAREAVRHSADPQFARMSSHDAGVWDFVG